MKGVQCYEHFIFILLYICILYVLHFHKKCVTITKGEIVKQKNMINIIFLFTLNILLDLFK